MLFKVSCLLTNVLLQMHQSAKLHSKYDNFALTGSFVSWLDCANFMSSLTTLNALLQFGTKCRSSFVDFRCDDAIDWKSSTGHNSPLHREQCWNGGKTCHPHKICSGKLDKQSSQDGRYAHEPALPFPAVVWSSYIMNILQWPRTICKKTKRNDRNISLTFF